MHAKYEVSISYGSKVIAKVKVDNRQTGQKQYAPDHLIQGHKKDLKWIFISYGIYKTIVFYIPLPTAQDIKTRNSFHKFHMKWKLMSDSIY